MLPFSFQCWWLEIWGFVVELAMSILFFFETQMSLCSLCLPVHKTFPIHLEAGRKDPASLHMKFVTLGFCTCGLSNLEYICVSWSHMEQ